MLLSSLMDTKSGNEKIYDFSGALHSTITVKSFQRSIYIYLDLNMFSFSHPLFITQFTYGVQKLPPQDTLRQT